MTLTFDEFRPHPLIRNAHLQTLGVNIYPSKQGVFFTRHRLETPDDDFLDVDVPQVTGVSLSANAPVVLVVHGLEGDSRGAYMHATYRALAHVGLHSVGMNLRSCSGEMNRTARLYHMGATEDVAFVLEWISQTYPNRPLGIVGYSLGGNLTLKYLGERTPIVKAGASVSPPFSLVGEQALSYYPNRLYALYLLRKLRNKARIKADVIRQHGGNPELAMSAQTLRVFDDAVTAPLHGFMDSQDYYQKCASGQFLPTINTPTLIIRAQDDPFFNADIPFDVIKKNPMLTGLFPKHGGHVGFIGDDWRVGKHTDWAQAQVARFLQSHLLG